jgi:hypothetical protein
MNLGWRYDVMVWFFDTYLFHSTVRKPRLRTADLARLHAGEAAPERWRWKRPNVLAQQVACAALTQESSTSPMPEPSPSEPASPSTERIGVIEQLAFPDQSFDVVLSTLMMHPLPDDLKRLGRGSNGPRPQTWGMPAGSRYEWPTGPWRSRLADQLALMKEAGFSPIETGFPSFRGLGFVRARKRESREKEGDRVVLRLTPHLIESLHRW